MNTPINEKSICVAFTEEVLLYLNNELPSKQMQLYKDHLTICTNCGINVQFNLELLALSQNNIEEEISDYKLELMINNAISNKANSSTISSCVSFIVILFQHSYSPFNGINKYINFFFGIVKSKRGPAGSGNTVVIHHGLRTMVAGTNGDAHII